MFFNCSEKRKFSKRTIMIIPEIKIYTHAVELDKMTWDTTD